MLSFLFTCTMFNKKQFNLLEHRLFIDAVHERSQVPVLGLEKELMVFGLDLDSHFYLDSILTWSQPA